MSLIVLDTDVASASLRNRLPDPLRAALAGHTMCITFVTVGELMKWRVLRSWGPSRARAGEAGKIESSFVILLVFLRARVCCWSGCYSGAVGEIIDRGLIGAVGLA